MTSICRDARPDVSSKIKRVGPFLLGPSLGNNLPVECFKQHLARRELTRDYYTLKVLTLPERDATEPEPLQEQQGRILIHTEYKVLRRLIGWSGVIQYHGFFKEVSDEQVEVEGKLKSQKVTQLCLLLGPEATPHDYDHRDSRRRTPLTNLQYYVLRNQKLPEPVAVTIFINIVQIVERLHRENIVHRDLKLGNFTFNVETMEVLLCNFGLAKELDYENQLLRDQRGSPAYISPEVISGHSYLGKPSDMWALGVTFYTMLFGRFPFYEKDPPDLFRKIKAGEYSIPGDAVIGSTSVNLIHSLLVMDPKKRLTASELLQKLKSYQSLRYSALETETPEALQVVPSGHKRSHSEVWSEEVLSGGAWGGEVLSATRSRSPIDLTVFDIEEVLMANASPLEKEEENAETAENNNDAEGGDQEPPLKRLRYAFNSTSGLRSIKISKVKAEPRVLTQGDLEKLYAIYVANKTKGRGLSGVTTTSAQASQQPQVMSPRDQPRATVGQDVANDDDNRSDDNESQLRNSAVESRTLSQNVSDSTSAAASNVNAKRLQQLQRLASSVPVL